MYKVYGDYTKYNPFLRQILEGRIGRPLQHDAHHSGNLGFHLGFTCNKMQQKLHMRQARTSSIHFRFSIFLQQRFWLSFPRRSVWGLPCHSLSGRLVDLPRVQALLSRALRFRVILKTLTLRFFIGWCLYFTFYWELSCSSLVLCIYLDLRVPLTIL